MAVGQGYSTLIGTRASAANPKVTEYYNTKTNQGFSDPNSLASFVNSNFAGSNASAANVFGLIGGNYTAPKPATPLVGPPAPTQTVPLLPSQLKSGMPPAAPAVPAPSNPYNPADLVKPFASLATPFSGLTGGTPTPNQPTPLTPTPIAPTLTPTTPVKPATGSTNVPMLPSQLKPATQDPAFLAKLYGDLVNKNGEIQNQVTGKKYSTPEQLAADLGVSTADIQWAKIPKVGASSSGTPVQPSVDFPDNITTPSGVTVNPATGGVVDPAQPDMTTDQAPPEPAAGQGYDSPEYQAALKAYQDSLEMSPEEQANQQAQDDLESSLAIGKANTGNQPIPMEFITGQQKAMEDRALALDVPLQKKAALLQAKRTASIDANKFALDEMDKQVEAAAAAHKPVSVGAGETLIDPATGKTVYSAPAKTNTSVVDVNGHKMLINSDTGATIKDLGSSDGTTNDAIVTSQIHAVSGTDANGNQFNQAFINLTDFPDAASKSQALAYGAANGIPVLNPGEGEKMVSIDNAYTNIDKISDSMGGLLANTPGLNLAEGLWNSVTKKLGNQGVASFNAWRTAVINNVQALAGGSGSGLRINQAEIDTALQNDLPVITGLGADTLGSAQAKLDRLKDQLDSWRSTILDKGNTAPSSGDTSALDSALDSIGFKNGSGGTPTATKTGARTDRNNNPTAMTTAVAKSLGLVEGKDYVNTNDTFSGGQYATAKLLGDPVQTTIKALDTAASRTAAQKAQNGGAFVTASGKNRWSYATPTDAQWLAMSSTQKVAAIQKMYQQEGGTQLASAFRLA